MGHPPPPPPFEILDPPLITLVLNKSFCYIQQVGASGVTMFWDGGGTRMNQMSCFLNTKIYKRFVDKLLSRQTLSCTLFTIFHALQRILGVQAVNVRAENKQPLF